MGTHLEEELRVSPRTLRQGRSSNGRPDTKGSNHQARRGGCKESLPEPGGRVPRANRKDNPSGEVSARVLFDGTRHGITTKARPSHNAEESSASGTSPAKTCPSFHPRPSNVAIHKRRQWHQFCPVATRSLAVKPSRLPEQSNESQHCNVRCHSRVQERNTRMFTTLPPRRSAAHRVQITDAPHCAKSQANMTTPR